MKRRYIIPEMVIVESAFDCPLLAGSETGQSGWIGAPPVNDIDMENDDVTPVNEEQNK